MEVTFPDSTFQFDQELPEEGMPYVFLLRQMLEHESTSTDVMIALRQAKRTRNLILGVADGNGPWFNSVQYRYIRLDDESTNDSLALVSSTFIMIKTCDRA